jgi:GT2 family glycosyltransferase
MSSEPLASVVIPTYNGASRIRNTLEALLPQCAAHGAEILVVDDGSRDQTADVVESYAPRVRILRHSNAGPAAARNRGAAEAKGAILLFTDDDCVPDPGWLQAMLAPFADPAVVGAKGIYRTHQRSWVARFVQLDYEDRYRLMEQLPSIDFIDTYSAGFVRERFLEMDGYDASFPVACAEDVELSFRMSGRGWVMKYVPGAVVAHTHPSTLANYLKKKYKFAYWRVVAVSKNPSKAGSDSHTPQVMKAQLLLGPALVVASLTDALVLRRPVATAAVAGLFVLSSAPFAARAVRKDPVVGMLSPLFLAARSVAQFLGVCGGLAYVYTRRGGTAETSRRPA